MDVSKITEVKQKLAEKGASEIDFFDVDGTLYRGRLLVDLVYAVIQASSERAYVRSLISEKYDLWHRGVVSTQGFHRFILKLVDEGFFVGLKQKNIDVIAQSLVKERRGLVYPFTSTLLNVLKLCQASHRNLLIAITGAPEEIAEEFCMGYGFDVVISSIYYTDASGCYTTDRDLDAGTNKAIVVRSIIEECGIQAGSSIGVGNTVADIPILTSVKYPIAINPDTALLQFIRENRCIGYVSDHEQRGVQIFRSDQDRRFAEVDIQAILPSDVAEAFPKMPGMR